MRFAADYGFKPAGYPYPSGRGYDLVLYLRNAGETKQAVLSDGQTPGWASGPADGCLCCELSVAVLLH